MFPHKEVVLLDFIPIDMHFAELGLIITVVVPWPSTTPMVIFMKQTKTEKLVSEADLSQPMRYLLGGTMILAATLEALTFQMFLQTQKI